MFDIGWSELALIAVVALVAIGPKELPSVLRTLGQWAGKVRRMASEFQGQFQEAMREAEMADLKESFDEVRKAASGFSKGTLITSLSRDVTSALRIDDPEKPMDPQAATAPTDAAVADASVTDAPAVPANPVPSTPETFHEAADQPAASEPLAVTQEAEEPKPAPQDTASAEPDVLKDARAS
ncbi:MAG TPA: Sec-independent protein translocase protein TatB [Bradyrhizobium sp.]|nr:Sec-independent protein translocase protein TatB [Bradyrhizobium sp.]